MNTISTKNISDIDISINYITEFVCTYNLFENLSESNDIYQIKLLQVFNLYIFDDIIINKTTEQLYEKYKNNTYIEQIIASTNKCIIDDNLTLFRMYFGFDTFYLFHSVLCSIINETSININKLNSLIDYNFI
jgi:hypothetical protein